MVKEAPISEKTRKGMSLNIDDRKFIKRQIDDLADAIKERMDEKLDENLKFIAEIVISSNNKMHGYMERIDARLNSIESILQDHERRITVLEDRFSNRRA